MHPTDMTEITPGYVQVDLDTVPRGILNYFTQRVKVQKIQLTETAYFNGAVHTWGLMDNEVICMKQNSCHIIKSRIATRIETPVYQILQGIVKAEPTELIRSVFLEDNSGSRLIRTTDMVTLDDGVITSLVSEEVEIAYCNKVELKPLSWGSIHWVSVEISSNYMLPCPWVIPVIWILPVAYKHKDMKRLLLIYLELIKSMTSVDQPSMSSAS